MTEKWELILLPRVDGVGAKLQHRDYEIIRVSSVLISSVRVFKVCKGCYSL